MLNKNLSYKFFDMLKIENDIVRKDSYHSEDHADKHKDNFLITIQ